MNVNNIQKFRFPVNPQHIRIIRAVTYPVLRSDIVTKTLSIIRIFEISLRMVQCPFEGKAADNFL